MLRRIVCFYLLLCFLPLHAQHVTQELEQLYQDVAIGHVNPSNLEPTFKKVKSILALPALTTEERLKAMLTLANLYKLKGDSTQVLKIAEEARAYASKNKLYLWEARLLGYLSSSYRESGMTALSHEKLQQALETAKKAPESEDVYQFYSSAYHEMAYYATAANEYPKAIAYIRLSNFWAKKVPHAKMTFFLASNYQYTGTLFNRMGAADSAIFYFTRSLELTGKTADLNANTLKNYVYVNMVYAYMLKKDLKTMRTLLTRVMNDSSQFKTHDINQDLYGHWISYYEMKGSTDSMRLFQNKLDSINMLISKSNSDAVNTVTKKLNDENKTLKNALNHSGYWYLSLLVLMAGSGIYWVLRSKHKKSKAAAVKTDAKPEELNIAKDTEQRLVDLLKAFEERKEYLNSEVSSTLLANQFNTNTKYITHTIKKLYGQDFNTYINTLRINHITNLLENESKYRQYKISYLAEITGYPSHSKFASVFKKIKGCAPSEFIAGLEEGSR